MGRGYDDSTVENTAELEAAKAAGDKLLGEVMGVEEDEDEKLLLGRAWEACRESMRAALLLGLLLLTGLGAIAGLAVGATTA